MKKYTVVLSVVLSCIVCFIIAFSFSSLKNESDIQLNKVEIEVDYNKINTYPTREEFDLESIITADNKYNTIIFKGKIIDLEEYEISWTDKNNETWGPFHVQ